MCDLVVVLVPLRVDPQLLSLRGNGHHVVCDNIKTAKVCKKNSDRSDP